MSKKKKQKTVFDEVEEKREKLSKIATSLFVYMQAKQPISVKTKVDELQERLQFRIATFENQLLDEKIDIYQQCLDLVKTDKK